MQPITHQSPLEPAFFSADMNNLQNATSRLQAIPVLGPLVVSPIKAFISICQLVAALATKIIFSTATLFTDNNFCKKANLAANHHIATGLSHFTYSALNVLSLGIFGYYAKHSSATLNLQKQLDPRATLLRRAQNNELNRNSNNANMNEFDRVSDADAEEVLWQNPIHANRIHSSFSNSNNTYHTYGPANDSDNEKEEEVVIRQTLIPLRRKISPEERVSNESLEDLLLDRREGITPSPYHRSNRHNRLSSPVSPLMTAALEIHEE